MTFASQILDTRRALGLTQVQLAAVLDTSEQTVSNWECERTTPWPKQQVAIMGKLLELQRGLHVVDTPDLPGTPAALMRDGEVIARLYSEGLPAWREEPAPVRARVIDRI